MKWFPYYKEVRLVLSSGLSLFTNRLLLYFIVSPSYYPS